jgi:hypothetical protein
MADTVALRSDATRNDRLGRQARYDFILLITDSCAAFSSPRWQVAHHACAFELNHFSIVSNEHAVGELELIRPGHHDTGPLTVGQFLAPRQPFLDIDYDWVVRDLDIRSNEVCALAK